ncbi:MAG: acylphosphatase [Candidatus Micrarchaeia archaeon]|jgi:acylphosphatase
MFHARFIASGSVQGVGFRDFVCRVGESCHLAGYAKNLSDGTVEIVAEGEGVQLDELARRLRGARMARGIHVEKLEEVENRKISARSFASFGVEC